MRLHELLGVLVVHGIGLVVLARRIAMHVDVEVGIVAVLRHPLAHTKNLDVEHQFRHVTLHFTEEAFSEYGRILQRREIEEHAAFRTKSVQLLQEPFILAQLVKYTELRQHLGYLFVHFLRLRIDVLFPFRLLYGDSSVAHPHLRQIIRVLLGIPARMIVHTATKCRNNLFHYLLPR